MKQVGKQTIIGGTDGPTSVFIVGKRDDKGKVSWKQRIHLFFYHRRREKVIAALKPGFHTLEEVGDYVKTRYNAVELPENDRSYIRQRNNCKSALVQRFRPDLLGEDRKRQSPKSESPEDIKVWLDEVKALEEKAATVAEKGFPFDYHLYHIEFLDYGTLDLEIEKEHQLLSVSYTSRPKKKKYLDRVAKDIYQYYGVTEEDIANKTERFQMLVMELAG